MDSQNNQNDQANQHDGHRNGRRSSSGGRKRGGKAGIIILVSVALLSGIGTVVYLMLEKYIPNFDIISYTEYYDMPEEAGISLVLGEEMLSDKPIMLNNSLFLPVDFVKTYVDKYIFWDDKADKLTITTDNKVMRMKTDELTYYVNNKPFELNLPVVKDSGAAYMSVELLMELYHIDIRYEDAYKTVIVDYLDTGRKIGQVTAKKARIRYEPDIKSPASDILALDTPVVMYGEKEEFTLVRTEEGRIGYILTKQLEQTDYIEPKQPEKEPSLSPVKAIDGKVNMVWDQVFRVETNSDESRRELHDGLNVLSPTWFSFDSDKMNGDIINIADINYVTWAHENNYLVWPLISDNFDGDLCHAVLSDTETREHVIRQLLAFIAMFNLDGINFDFEALRAEDAEYYLQFFRELAPLMKEQGAVLSVDMYVPSAWSMYYNRTEVGKVVDYICVMTYDEHWSTAEESGPVASIGFVKEGVTDTLLEVPAEKLIMGLPFYVRVWREEEIDGEISRSLSNYGMAYAYELFIENGAEFVWLEDMGCYYGEYKATEDGQEVRYRVWLEDESSIEQKMKIFAQYDLAGVAGWKRGLEKPEIWELLKTYIST